MVVKKQVRGPFHEIVVPTDCSSSSARALEFALALVGRGSRVTAVPRRRLDDRLREICAKLRTASNDELEDSLQELLALIHRKAERLKARGGRVLLQGEQLEPERRKSMM